MTKVEEPLTGAASEITIPLDKFDVAEAERQRADVLREDPGQMDILKRLAEAADARGVPAAATVTRVHDAFDNALDFISTSTGGPPLPKPITPPTGPQKGEELGRADSRMELPKVIDIPADGELKLQDEEVGTVKINLGTIGLSGFTSLNLGANRGTVIGLEDTTTAIRHSTGVVSLIEEPVPEDQSWSLSPRGTIDRNAGQVVLEGATPSICINSQSALGEVSITSDTARIISTKPLITDRSDTTSDGIRARISTGLKVANTETALQKAFYRLPVDDLNSLFNEYGQVTSALFSSGGKLVISGGEVVTITLPAENLAQGVDHRSLLVTFELRRAPQSDSDTLTPMLVMTKITEVAQVAESILDIPAKSTPKTTPTENGDVHLTHDMLTDLPSAFRIENAQKAGLRETSPVESGLIDNQAKLTISEPEARQFGINLMGGEISCHTKAVLTLVDNRGRVSLSRASRTFLGINRGTLHIHDHAIATVGILSSQQAFGTDYSRTYVDLAAPESEFNIFSDSAFIITPGGSGIKIIPLSPVSRGKDIIKKVHYTLPKGVSSLDTLISEGQIDGDFVRKCGGKVVGEKQIQLPSRNGLGDILNITFEIQNMPDADGKLYSTLVMVEADAQKDINAADLQDILPEVTLTIDDDSRNSYGVNKGEVAVNRRHNRDIVAFARNEGTLRLDSEAPVHLWTNRELIHSRPPTLSTIQVNENQIFQHGGSMYVEQQAEIGEILISTDTEPSIIITPSVFGGKIELAASFIGGDKKEVSDRIINSSHYVLLNGVSTHSLLKGDEIDSDLVLKCGGEMHSENELSLIAINGNGDKVSVGFERKKVPNEKGVLTTVLVMNSIKN